MKIKFNSIFFIYFIFLLTFNVIGSEPDGTSIFVLDVDGNPDIVRLGRSIEGEMTKNLDKIKRQLILGVDEELKRYEKFKSEITEELKNPRLSTKSLQDIAEKIFPEIYPAHIEKPEIHDRHKSLALLFKLKLPSGKKPSAIRRREASKARIFTSIDQTEREFLSFRRDLLSGKVIPTKKFHITLCECGAGGCNKSRLKQLFSQFYDTETKYIEFVIEKIAVYEEGPGWIVLEIKSSYLDKLMWKLRTDTTFKCNVRPGFKAHISILKFDGFERGLKNMVLQLFREFLITNERELLRGIQKIYCININRFGIKNDEMKSLQ